MEDPAARFTAMMAVHQEKLSGSGVSVETQLDGMKQCIDSLTKTVTRLIASGSKSERNVIHLQEVTERQERMIQQQRVQLLDLKHRNKEVYTEMSRLREEMNRHMQVVELILA